MGYIYGELYLTKANFRCSVTLPIWPCLEEHFHLHKKLHGQLFKCIIYQLQKNQIVSLFFKEKDSKLNILAQKQPTVVL